MASPVLYHTQDHGALLCLVLAMCCPLLVPAIAHADDYEETFERALQLEEDERYDEAISELTPLAEHYPQDYKVRLQLAWLHFRAGRYAEALPHYEKAYALSNGALDPTLGLGWTHAKLGDNERAKTYFEEALDRDSDNASAKEGLALLEAAPDVAAATSWYVDLFAGGATRFYSDATNLSVAAGPVLGVGVGRGDFALGATYRGLGYQADSDTRFGLASQHQGMNDDARRSNSTGSGDTAGATSSSQSELGWQHEIYGTLAYGTAGWGVSAHYARIASGEVDGHDANVGGGVVRLSPFGDITLEASYSAYPDENVWRISPGWQLPIIDGFYIRPSGAFQVTTRMGDTYWTGSIATGWTSEGTSVEIGGKYGEQWRPVYLTLPVAYNDDGVIEWGAWGSFRP